GVSSTLAFSPDGKTLAASSSQTGVNLWNIATGKLRTRLESEAATVVSLAYSRDGRTLVMGNTASLVLLDVLTETERCRITDPTANALGLAFSLDGRRIVTAGSGGLITLWDPTGLGDMSRKGKVTITAAGLE